MDKLTSGLLVAFIVGSSNAANIDSGTYRPLNILADDFAMDNKPAFSVSFGKSTNDFFSFTAQCSIFDKSSSKTTTRGNKLAPEISLEYYNNVKKQLMTSDSKFDTYAEIDISIDKVKNVLIFNISGAIYDEKTDSIYKVSPQNLILSADEARKIRNGCKDR